MEKYESLVKKLAYTRSLTSGFPVEDLVQELRLKILEMKRDNKCLDFPYVKAALQNMINALIRQNYKNIDSNQINKASEEELLNITYEDNSTNKLEFFILVRLILEWADKQDDITRLIINSFLYPSEDLERYWGTVQVENKRFRNREMIPLFTIAKYLKIDKNKITELEKKLAKYLCGQGYFV